MSPAEIINRIRKSLRQKQMTQRDLATALGKKEAEISRWMSGRVGISEMNLRRIEDVLDIALTKGSLAQETGTKLRFGVIGTGSIARRFASEAPYVDNAVITAAFNPDMAAARSFCKEFGIPKEASSADDLISNCDAIYIASPVYTHYEYAKKALLSGRHVLCEIPLTESAEQTAELISIADKNGLTFMAAIKTAYAPSFGKIIEVAKSGEIGEIVELSATVTTLLDDSYSIGYNNERMCENTYYALFIANKLLEGKISKTSTFIRRDDKRIEYLSASLYSDRAAASIKIGTGVKSESSMVISGTKGYIYVPAPWWKPDYFEIRFENPYDNKKMYFPYESAGLRYEIQHFIDKVAMKPVEDPISREELLRISRFTDKYLSL